MHRVFRREVVKSLVGETNPQPTQVRGAANPRDVEHLTGRHFLSKITQKEGQKSKPLRTYPVCSTTTRKRKTVGDGRKIVWSSYECKVCDIGLCVDPCFKLLIIVFRTKMLKVVTLNDVFRWCSYTWDWKLHLRLNTHWCFFFLFFGWKIPPCV